MINSKVSITINIRTKIELSCKKHPSHAFTMLPSAIFKGINGCILCTKNIDKVISKQEFLAKCKTLAHVYLDFSQISYQNQKSRLKLSCKKHPEKVFYMQVDTVLRGKTRCSSCLGWATNQEEFLAKCKNKAFKHIDFSKAIYKDNKTKVELSCKIHPGQVFYMTPNNLYKGYVGCHVCKKELKKKLSQKHSKTQEQFLEKCKQLAYRHIDCSKAVYVNNKTKVELSCQKHPGQVFYMTPNSLVNSYSLYYTIT